MWRRINLIKATLTIVLLVIISVVSVSAHPFYVSVMELEQNPKTGNYEISLKFFVDDLEKGMNRNGFGALFLGEDNEIATADSLIESYIRTKFSIGNGEVDFHYNVLGKQVENEDLYLFIEVTPEQGELQRLEIRNTVLFEIYETQTNIIHLKRNGQINSLMLDKSKPQGVFEF